MAESGGAAAPSAPEASGVESSMVRLAVADAADGKPAGGGGGEAEELVDAEQTEVVLFRLDECYVYKIPPRKTAASHRADEWNINKWAWEGAITVASRGDDCTIRLHDRGTSELFAQAPVRPDQPLPVEAVIDSSRFFVLRIEDSSPPAAPPASASNKAGKAAAAAAAAAAPSVVRHAFIGLGFRERTAAYDFQAAVYDHVKYVNKQREARLMGQAYDSKPAADYRLKDGQKLHLDLKTPSLRAKPCTAGLPLSPTTPGNVAFKPHSILASHAPTAPDAPSPMRQASGEHADAAPSSPDAAATTAAARSSNSSDSSSSAAATPPILPPPPPARLSSPPSTCFSSPSSALASAPSSASPSIAWAFQSDSPPPPAPQPVGSAAPASAEAAAGGGAGEGADDTDDFGDFVAA
ncbi:hypothetical protein CLOM_g9763 [Closterium sp. NIES-68]|nr:hypothetical protein CLOM_g9763 [Closterium sp. NIES-68]GJP76731.1 hypothetical protein CLOP_g7197 [Closterium sp. NIES-67]